jgi:hypothetical protein
MYGGLHIKYPFSRHIFTETKFSRQIFEKYSNKNFTKMCVGGAGLFRADGKAKMMAGLFRADGKAKMMAGLFRADGKAKMMKLIFAFRNFANAPNNWH